MTPQDWVGRATASLISACIFLIGSIFETDGKISAKKGKHNFKATSKSLTNSRNFVESPSLWTWDWSTIISVENVKESIF